jgi:hypothetical protein
MMESESVQLFAILFTFADLCLSGIILWIDGLSSSSVHPLLVEPLNIAITIVPTIFLAVFVMEVRRRGGYGG